MQTLQVFCENNSRTDQRVVTKISTPNILFFGTHLMSLSYSNQKLEAKIVDTPIS